MRETVKKVIILGSSALKIGEAGEFDYSGSQAIKALKEEGIEVILINPNIATIQTSEELADEVYFLPVTPDFVEKIIEKEKPDGILLSFGGQTALNCGVKLFDSGVLAKHNVRVLGTPVQAIKETEDRELFVNRLKEINAICPRSQAAGTLEDALRIANEIGYPVMVRIAYALGGLGSGQCRNEEELRAKTEKALSYTDQILIEEYLKGWKEVEYEVVRDRFDNCITVCNMENFDPLGIHTGESIVVAPSQTLSNREYHNLREVAIRVIRHLGIVGECNIQYALDPYSEEYRIIEVNARLSRSSALASKATGYPLAFIAAKLALGYGLYELPNAVTKVTKAFYEPSLDYCVVKIPRWDLKKFRKVSRKIGSAMKSVGEVMAIGRSFEETLQKALRMLDIGAKGMVGNFHWKFENVEEELSKPTEERIFAIVEAFKLGYTVDRVHELTHITPWFLHKIHKIVDIRNRIRKNYKGVDVPVELLREAKRAGFSDEQVAILTERKEDDIRAWRHKNNLRPIVRQIDTLGAEYPAQTNYLYLSYHGDRDDLTFDAINSVLILGSGSYRIGCSVEFDWCCVNAARTLRNLGFSTAMLNYNPETVSTDYDESDQLFFDEINLESVIEIYEKIQPIGVVLSMGGQIPNNLALKLHQRGIKVLGTSPESIDMAENRQKFSAALDELKIDQPTWEQLTSLQDALDFADQVGYPVLIRPSYVLSGAAMVVSTNPEELTRFIAAAASISKEYPVVISKFLENAKEIEFDAVAKDGEIVIYAISEHVENAGVHSGDATLVLPPQRTYFDTMRQIRHISEKIAKRFKINGPFNIQFIAKNNEVKVIECNLRASRSFPFVSKILRHNFIDIAARVLVGRKVAKIDNPLFELNYVGVKAPHFSFTRLEGADPTTGVEMASTGEVACLGDDFDEAFLKALLSVGYRLPVKSVLMSSGRLDSKVELLESAKMLKQMNIALYTTGGTHDFLKENGVESIPLRWPLDGGEPNTLTYIKEGKIDLVINLPKNFQETELTNDYLIRRTAVDFNVPLITNRQIAQRFIEAISRKKWSDLKIKPWSHYK